MPLFESEQEVYEYLGLLFEELVADAELGPQFQRADTILQYRCREPEALITLDIRAGAEPHVELGPTELDTEVVLTMDADTAHAFVLGKLNITLAIARGLIKPKGPVTKILKLVPLIKPVSPRYEARLVAAGRADLVEGSGKAAI